MRLWHQKLISKLDREHLLGQHRECCALRGKGWGKKHATVNYVFKHPMAKLCAYHKLVMDEMNKRGYNVAPEWRDYTYRGKKIGKTTDSEWKTKWYNYYIEKLAERKRLLYREHNNEYFLVCLLLLKERESKNADL